MNTVDNEDLMPDPADPQESKANDARKLILLAEDNEAGSMALADYLQTFDYRIIVARNGPEAFELAVQERPHLILMDVQMPLMDGLETTRRIRADERVAAIPVIAVTAFAMAGDRERCLQAGADDYMSKPVSLKRLLTVIEGFLKR